MNNYKDAAGSSKRNDRERREYSVKREILLYSSPFSIVILY